MRNDPELDHLRKAQRRLKARLEEIERRIQDHLATKPTDPFNDLVKSHSLHPHTSLPYLNANRHPSPHDPMHLPPLCYQI